MNCIRAILLILATLLSACSIEQKRPESDFVFSRDIDARNAQLALIVTFDSAPFHDPALHAGQAGDDDVCLLSFPCLSLRTG